MNLYDAILLATRAHYGQRDLSGEPYILHLFRVMLEMPTDELRMVAVLHDILEDTDCTIEDLRRQECPEKIINAVECLSLRKDNGETFTGHLERIKTDPLAMRVKVSDIEDNLKLSRILVRNQHDLMMTQHYVGAHRELTNILGAMNNSSRPVSVSPAPSAIASVSPVQSVIASVSPVQSVVASVAPAQSAIASVSPAPSIVVQVSKPVSFNATSPVSFNATSPISHGERGGMSIADLLYPVAHGKHSPSPVADILPAWGTMQFLLEARLIPVASQILPWHPYSWCGALLKEIEPWNDRILTVQEALRTATVDILTACSEMRPAIVPLKGIDALLWAGGRYGRVHTRDLDFLIDPANRPAIEERLREMGYAQIDMLDCESGHAQLVSDEKKRAREEGNYEYWPWTKHYSMPSLHAGVDLSRPGASRVREEGLTLERVTWPLSVVRGQVVIGIEVDLHHSVWPSISHDRLRSGYSSYGTRLFGRMMIADQLVTTTTKIVAELMEGKRSALGSLAQILQLIQEQGSPEMTAECRRRAGELGLATEWETAITLAGTILGWRVEGDERFPHVGRNDIAGKVRDIAMQSFLGAVCTDM